MTATVETGALQNLFKRVYKDEIVNQLPSFAELQRDWRFDTGNKTGDRYERAVMLRYPNGATYGGSSVRRTAYAYNDARAGATQPAYASPTEYTLREQIAYGLISSAASSEQAMAAAMDAIVMGMVEASRFHLETCLLYGATSLGAVDSVGGSGTSGTAVITKASWAAALWNASEGGEFDAYDPTLTTKRNTNGPIQLTSVNTTTRELALTYAANADRTAVLAGDVFVPVGANGNWFAGLDSIITTSVAGTTTLGISPASYGMWKANSYAAGGVALTFLKVMSACAQIAARGGMGDLKCIVSSWTFIDLMNEQAAFRRYTESNGGEFTTGAKDVTYYGPNGGTVTITQHPLVKAGEAFIYSPGDFVRVGSSEPTFNLPGRTPDNPMFLLELPANAGFEVRRWWDQTLFCDRLVRVGKITGIVNTSL